MSPDNAQNRIHGLVDAQPSGINDHRVRSRYERGMQPLPVLPVRSLMSAAYNAVFRLTGPATGPFPRP